MQKPLTLKTSRDDVVLRVLTAADAHTLFHIIDENREHLSKWNDPTAAKYLTEDSVRMSVIEPHDPERLRFGIWRKTELVGSINLAPLPEFAHAEVGYWLAEEYTGLGYMSAAVRGLIKFAFEVREYYFLRANVRVENLASRQLLERIGFTCVSQICSIGNAYANYRLRSIDLS